MIRKVWADQCDNSFSHIGSLKKHQRVDTTKFNHLYLEYLPVSNIIELYERYFEINEWVGIQKNQNINIKKKLKIYNLFLILNLKKI